MNGRISYVVIAGPPFVCAAVHDKVTCWSPGTPVTFAGALGTTRGCGAASATVGTATAANIPRRHTTDIDGRRTQDLQLTPLILTRSRGTLVRESGKSSASVALAGDEAVGVVDA